jgi:hypothetical protein
MRALLATALCICPAAWSFARRRPNPQSKQKTRVGEVVITNCVSTDTTWASREIAATQWLNTRAKSARTYHLIISLKDGANPDAQTLRMIEERFCKALGYAEHQRISVAHHETDNVHIHVAINKIHPTTFTLHNPGCDYKTLKICGSIFQNTFADVRLFQKEMSGRLAEL